MPTTVKHHKDVFDTIAYYIEKGLDVDRAIEKVEGILRTKLPGNIVLLIKQKFE